MKTNDGFYILHQSLNQAIINRFSEHNKKSKLEMAA
jgi:hypothetical protein